MSKRSYSKVWLHIIWGTDSRINNLPDRDLRKSISHFLFEYTREKNIYMKANFVNSDHVHILLDLPTNVTVEDTVRLLKGRTSKWINERVNYKFQWGTGYGVFSVSESMLDKTIKYILNQEDHHKRASFSDEYNKFLKKYKLGH